MSKILRTSPVLAALLLASCGGGGSSSGNNAANTAELSLTVCSLGCNSGTCSVRKIPVNSDIVFTFNDNILSSSVSLTSIAMVNLTNGGSPTGSFIIEGNVVTFRPSYSDTSDGVSFGFEDSNTYSLVLPAAPGDSAVVRSRGGRPNASRLSCTFEASGVRDFVPGPPTVTVLPNADHPPTSRAFDLSLSFNDLVRSSQLLSPNGTSPTVSVNLVSIDGFGSEVTFPLDGTFVFENNIVARTTTLTFQPIGELPTGQGGTRWVRVDVSNQITDLVGNRLVNAGSFVVPLPEESGATGTVTETFDTTAKIDALKSAPGLWEGTGRLVSGLKPATGQHPGGGSGVFGSPDLDDFVFDTGVAPAAGMVPSELLGIDLPVTDGVMMFSSLELAAGRSASGMGTRPLRLFVRGSADIRGNLDFSGEDGEVNFSMYRPDDERLNYGSLSADPPSLDMIALLVDPLENAGGAGGAAALGGGAGGIGGFGWHTVPTYYDDAKTGWFSEHTGAGAADPTRYRNGLTGPAIVGVHGANGGRVGGLDPLGAPMPNTAANQILGDALAGSGMGTFAWPPKANVIPSVNDVNNKSWASNLAGTAISAYNYNKVTSVYFFRQYGVARARGAGGGGYWTDGLRGDVHDEDLLRQDSFGQFLSENPPDFARYNATLQTNFDFNGVPGAGGDITDPSDRELWPSYIRWDNQGANIVHDGVGGEFTPLVGGNPELFYTLDPVQGFLRGGAGGGGAGNSQTGSFSLETSSPSLALGDIESYRDSDGCGGGAGGGGVQLQVARDLNLSGTIDLKGGDGGTSATRVSSSYALDTAGFFTNRAGSAGGGGGAGGGLLLQVGGTTQFLGGTINLAGGSGGQGAIGNDGGDGGIGLLRFESSQALSLGGASGIVTPIESYDLSTRPEFSLSGANQGAFTVGLGGSLGDQTVAKTVGTGTVFFNGNSTGVASEWYEADPGKLFLIFDSWEITVEWSNGVSGPQSITYNDANRTTPGVTPVWAAFQTAYGFEDGGTIEADPGSEYGWIIPGYNTVAGGNAELQGAPASTRLIRYQLVFDQDLVSSRIGTNPAAYFRVTSISFDWKE
jgi:hypothetical protein